MARPLAGILFTSLLAAVSACDRYEPDAGLPTSPGYQNALVVTLSSETVPADGFSTITVSAQISSNADSTLRTLEFVTSAGDFLEAVSGTPKTAERTVDATGRAAATLRASQDPGPAQVVVRVKAKPEIARIATVNFTAASAGATISIAADSTSIPADGFSTTAMTATINAAVPAAGRKVRFTTTRGSFLGGTTTIEVDADESGRARADLVSSQTPSTARVTAAAFNVTSETAVTFTPALPDAIIVQPDKLELKAGIGNDSTTTLRVRLLRTAGKVSTGLTPEYTAVNAATGEALPLLFRNIEPADDQGVATATLTAGPTSFSGTARIEVRVRGSAAAGTANIVIVQPPSSGT